MKALTERLILLSDKDYADFSAKLLPGVPRETIIGVRAPEIKKIASEISKTDEGERFLAELPHAYYDENMLHSALLTKYKDVDRCFVLLDEFLPYVDNWSVCDTLAPAALKKDEKKTLQKVKEWLSSEHTYTRRFAIKILMNFFLDEKFKKEYSDWVASIRSEDYYVNMMIAWYFATALAKQYDAAITYLEGNVLSDRVHNKTIQKSVESYRISEERKAYLRTLRK